MIYLQFLIRDSVTLARMIEVFASVVGDGDIREVTFETVTDVNASALIVLFRGDETSGALNSFTRSRFEVGDANAVSVDLYGFISEETVLGVANTARFDGGKDGSGSKNGSNDSHGVSVMRISWNEWFDSKFQF